MLHPITFSFPEEKISSDIPLKTKILSNLIPGKISTYIYSTEVDYYNEYRSSYFAITTKKGGWDCLRHYEIIANRCLPVFPNIEKCPPLTMALLPKDLIIESNTLYDTVRLKKLMELTDDFKSSYLQLVEKMINILKSTLTTSSMASYIFRNSGISPTNILFLSGQTSPDYLRCLTLHGMKSILGARCHDYPKIPHIYKGQSGYNILYGKGITYSNLLESSERDDRNDLAIVEKIKSYYFDLIVYGSYHRGMPFLDVVNESYSPNQIILLCGEDDHVCNYNEWVRKGYVVFVRELQ
jgi:hypothetical protein